MANARSGSTLLEELIFRMIYKDGTLEEPAIRLSEFLHHDLITYSDSNTKYFIKRNIKYDTSIRKEHTKKIIDIIRNTKSPMVLKIFPQIWQYNNPIINLEEFLNLLKYQQFNFVYLKRNFKDRLLSLIVAQHSKVWHKHVIGNDIRFSTGNNNFINIDKNNKIKIDIIQLGKTYYEHRMTDYFLDQEFKTFPGKIINYENFETDCFHAGIEITNTRIKKLYKEPYTDLIENYQEVSNFIDNFKYKV